MGHTAASDRQDKTLNEVKARYRLFRRDLATSSVRFLALVSLCLVCVSIFFVSEWLRKAKSHVIGANGDLPTSVQNSESKLRDNPGARLPPAVFQRKPPSPELIINGVQALDFRSETAQIALSGDFSGFAQALSVLDLNQRIIYGRKIPLLFSPLGPAHDVPEKLKLIELMGSQVDLQESIRRSVFEEEAKLRFAEVVSSGCIELIDNEDFASMCVGLSKTGLSRGLSAAASGANAEMQRHAARKVASFSMLAGPLEASQAISQLPAGMVRDEIVAGMVLFLKRTGSADEAAAWAATIIDEQARKRVER